MTQAIFFQIRKKYYREVVEQLKDLFSSRTEFPYEQFESLNNTTDNLNLTFTKSWQKMSIGYRFILYFDELVNLFQYSSGGERTDTWKRASRIELFIIETDSISGYVAVIPKYISQCKKIVQILNQLIATKINSDESVFLGVNFNLTHDILEELLKSQTPKEVNYTILAFTFLAVIIGIWALLHSYKII